MESCPDWGLLLQGIGDGVEGRIAEGLGSEGLGSVVKSCIILVNWGRS